MLPPNALTGARIGISASPSADLARLGLMEAHFQLALGELARSVLILGGGLQYAGHLDPAGYTSFLIGELRRFGRGGVPLTAVLAWPVHRGLSMTELTRARELLGVQGSIVTLDARGAEMDPRSHRGDGPVPTPPEEIASSLTSMRSYAQAHSSGRFVLGGRRSGYQGSMPGVIEEVILSLQGAQPTYLAGGFGGATLDLVRALVPGAASWFEPAADQFSDEGTTMGLGVASEIAAGREWDALNNGLTADENLRLAATHRPSEIAALVSLGLGRLAVAGKLTSI